MMRRRRSVLVLDSWIADGSAWLSFQNAPRVIGDRPGCDCDEAFVKARAWSLPRKEVIQPHVPVRLPCYDFVPVTSLTLGACPAYALAQRLQVLPASMT
jgi:hypothetical protein